MKKQRKEEWFDFFSYILMTLVITVFILCFIQDRSDLLALLNVLLLLLSSGLLLLYLSYRKKKRQYEQLFQWVRGGLRENNELPQDLQRQIHRLYQELEKKNSYETLQAHMEFAALQNQINPHFLYNTLDAIRSQALAVHADEIADMTGKLSRFFRYSIRNRGDLVTISDEIKNVEDYFSIQHYRFEDRFSLEIICDHPEALEFYIPKMTFQPLVENALYHGLEPKKGEGRLSIRILQREHSLQVIIGDNGIGMAEEQVEKVNRRFQGAPPDQGMQGSGTGIALYNVNKRLQILFGEMYGLHITSTLERGSDVEVLLPLVDHEQRSKYQLGNISRR